MYLTPDAESGERRRGLSAERQETEKKPRLGSTEPRRGRAGRKQRSRFLLFAERIDHFHMTLAFAFIELKAGVLVRITARQAPALESRMDGDAHVRLVVGSLVAHIACEA